MPVKIDLGKFYIKLLMHREIKDRVMKILYLIISLFFIMSCQNNIEKKDNIDDIIAKYDQKDFSYFKDIFIAIRNSNRNEIIYIVDKSEGNLPVYFVKYTKNNGNIEINRKALDKVMIKDYFTDAKIQDIIENFRKYKLFLLQVDKEGNVYMNPFRINEPAILLRLVQSSESKEVKKGFIYKHYKNNWYIKK